MQRTARRRHLSSGVSVDQVATGARAVDGPAGLELDVFHSRWSFDLRGRTKYRRWLWLDAVCRRSLDLDFLVSRDEGKKRQNRGSDGLPLRFPKPAAAAG